MAVRVSDNLKPQNDSTEFPVAYGEDIWLDKNKGSGTPNYDSIQNMLNNDELGGGSSTQVDTMPIASVDELGKIYQYTGSSGTYTNGFFYQCKAWGYLGWDCDGTILYTKDTETVVGKNVYIDSSGTMSLEGTIAQVADDYSTLTYIDTNEDTHECTRDNNEDMANQGYTWIEKEVSPSNVKVDNESIVQDSSTYKISVAETYETTKTCKDIDEWNALSPTEQAKYENVILEQDETTTPISIVDMVQNGNMHAVTSNAVHDYVQTIKDVIPSNASSSNKLVSASDNNFKYQTVAKDTDFNTVKTPGVYSFGVSEKETTHAPLVGTFTLIVSCQNNDWVQQLVIFNGDGRTFVRISSSGNWSDWTELSKERNMVASSSSIQSLQALLDEVQPQLWIEGTYQGALIINSWGVGTYQMTKTTNESANHKTVIYGTFSTATENAQPFIATYTSSNTWNIIYTALKSEVVRKFDTTITPTSGVTGLYNTVIDCATQLVTVLKTKGASSYSGLVTYSGSWSGQYLGLVFDALCVVQGTFRNGNNIHNFKAVHDGTNLIIDTDVPQSGSATPTSACELQGGGCTWIKCGNMVMVNVYTTCHIDESQLLTLFTGLPKPLAEVQNVNTWNGSRDKVIVLINTFGELRAYADANVGININVGIQSSFTYFTND